MLHHPKQREIMAQKLTLLSCILSLCIGFSSAHAMMREEPDIEMGMVNQKSSQNIKSPRPTLLIEQPTVVSPCCISKHLVLAACQSGCITGMIFCRDMPILMTMVGILEAIFLGIQIQQIHQDCKSIPKNKALYNQLTHRLEIENSLTRLTPSNTVIPFEVIQVYDHALSKATDKKIKALLYDTTVLPAPPLLKESELLERKERYSTLAKCLIRYRPEIPKDMRQTILAQMPELFYAEKQFCMVMPYVREYTLDKLIAMCPMSWFNAYYNVLSDEDTKKRFAYHIAHAMSDVDMNRKRFLITINEQVEYQIPDEEALANHLYHNYLEQITAPPTHQLSNVLDQHHKANNNLQM